MGKPTYKVDVPFQVNARSSYRRRLLIAGVIVLVIGAAAFAVIYDSFLSHKDTGLPVAGPTEKKSIAGAQTFTSTYFQFTDTAKWEFMKADSTASKFTYINYVAKLPAHSVTVYVNQTPSTIDLATNRVLPVNLVNGNAFTVGSPSDHCGQLLKPGEPKRVHTRAIAGTTMLCVPDAPQYSLQVGLVGGDYNLNLTRLSGQKARYVIIYRNLTAEPDPGPFLRIMRTFKAI